MSAIESSGTSTTRRLTPQREAGTPLIELRHLADPLDGTFMRLAAEHGDKVSTLADYPEFAARFTTPKGEAR